MDGSPTAITIRGPRLVLRPLTPTEIDDAWGEMVEADPMVITALPSEAAFRERLERSGSMVDGWLDLAIDPRRRGTHREHDRTWVMYAITRERWEVRRSG